MTFTKKIAILLIFGSWFLINNSNAQQIDTSIVNYKDPKKFRVAAVEISGTQFLDKNIIRSLTGIKIGDLISIPGDDITKCIKNLWKQGLFGNVKIYADKFDGENVYLTVDVLEKPRLNEITLKGLKKSDADDLKKKLDLLKGKPLTEALKLNVRNTIADQF